MRHLVYAAKVMINEDLKAQDRRHQRRAARRADRAAIATRDAAPEQKAQPESVRSADVVRPRPATRGA